MHWPIEWVKLRKQKQRFMHAVAIYFHGGGDCIFNFIFMDVVVVFVKFSDDVNKIRCTERIYVYEYTTGIRTLSRFRSHIFFVYGRFPPNLNNSMIQTDENSDRQSQAIRYQNWISQLLAFGEYIPIVEKAFVWIFVSFEVSWRNRKFFVKGLLGILDIFQNSWIWIIFPIKDFRCSEFDVQKKFLHC